MIAHDTLCRHGKYPYDPTRDGCWACFDEAVNRGEIISHDPAIIAPPPKAYNPADFGYAEVAVYEPRIRTLTPFHGVIHDVDTLLGEWRDTRELGRRLEEIGVTPELARDIVAHIKEAQRRAHRDDDGGYYPALRVEIDDVDPRRWIEFEVQKCLNDDDVRYEFHRQALEKSTRLPWRLTDDEPLNVDELAMSPEVAAIHDEAGNQIDPDRMAAPMATCDSSWLVETVEQRAPGLQFQTSQS